jgi:hypothetical protein
MSFDLSEQAVTAAALDPRRDVHKNSSEVGEEAVAARTACCAESSDGRCGTRRAALRQPFHATIIRLIGQGWRRYGRTARYMLG